jgi:hypothetical protein
MCVGNNVRHTHTHTYTVYQHRNVLKPHAGRYTKEPIRRVIWCAAQNTMHFAHGVSWDACSPGVVAPADRYTTRDHVITQSVMHNMLPMATIVSEYDTLATRRGERGGVWKTERLVSKTETRISKIYG